MHIFDQTKKQKLLFWIVLLSISLLCAQNLTLHVHDLSHEHTQHFDNTVENMHSHIADAHLSTDTSHINQHDNILSETKIKQSGLITVASHLFALSFFIILVTLLFFGHSRQISYRFRNENTIFQLRYLKSPQLRAPPTRNIIY